MKHPLREVVFESFVVDEYAVLYAGKLLKDGLEFTVAEFGCIVKLEDIIELLICDVAVVVRVDLLDHLNYILQLVVTH